MDQPHIIPASFIETHTDFPTLVDVLRNGFCTEDNITPMRHHQDFANPKEGVDSTLLLMPSINVGRNLGIKIVAVSPNNKKYNRPTIQGTYIYIDAHQGYLKAILDAKSLTNKRTACTSALASQYLSKKNASSLLLIGTGALAVDMIKAHTSVRPIREVFVWGRDNLKAQDICAEFVDAPFTCIAISTIEEKISTVDIISCATLSPSPLILGKWLRPGQHIDLVGSYKKNTREADDETILKSNIYVDTYQGGLKESGDIVIPLKTGILKEEDIKADLYELCQQKKPGRLHDDEITVFKSVGHATEDLAAASYYFDLYTRQ